MSSMPTVEAGEARLAGEACDECIDQQIVSLVQRSPQIKVPQIAERLGLSPLDLAGTLPDIIERQGWDRGTLSFCRSGGE
jgi:hypothetical protein